VVQTLVNHQDNLLMHDYYAATLTMTAPINDSVVLIGDAAHCWPPSFQQAGASVAVEDGYVLAQCIADLTLEHPLEQFHKERAARIKKMRARCLRDAIGSQSPIVEMGTLVSWFTKKLLIWRNSSKSQTNWARSVFEQKFPLGHFTR